MEKQCAVIVFILSLVVFAAGTINLAAAQDANDSLRYDSINLLDGNFVWQPGIQAKVFQTDGQALDILINTNSNDELFNRAYLPIDLRNLSESPSALVLNYSYASNNNETIFAAEVRDMQNNSKSGSSLAYYSLDSKSSEVVIPLDMDIRNIPVEFRLYGLTDGPAFSMLNVKEARLLFDN